MEAADGKQYLTDVATIQEKNREIEHGLQQQARMPTVVGKLPPPFRPDLRRQAENMKSF